MSNNIAVKDNVTGGSKRVRALALTDGLSPDVSSEYAPYHHIHSVGEGQYETVAAAATDQALGASGAAGDWLRGLLIVPATTGAGTVSIKDGAGSGINVFVSGTLADLTPIWIPLWIKSTSGAWKVTTGSNVSVIAVGNFT